MVFGLMKKGWRTKSKVPTEQFSALLSTALNRAAAHRDPDEIFHEVGLGDGPPTNEQWTRYFELCQQEFLRVQGPMEELSSIAPSDARLGDIHVRAVGYLRGFLKLQDLTVGLMLGQIRRDERMRQRSLRDLESWERTVADVTKDFSRDLDALKRDYPSLYQQLGLSEASLIILELADDVEPTGGDWSDPEWSRWRDRQVATMQDEHDDKLDW